MAKKFRAKPLKKWLDTLAAAVVKTRDNSTCQIVHDPACAGTMLPLDQNCQCCHIISRGSNETRWDLFNLITGCGHCHKWGHDNPAEFGMWFRGKYPHRLQYLSQFPKEKRTWRESDFRYWETFLLQILVLPILLPIFLSVRYLPQLLHTLLELWVVEIPALLFRLLCDASAKAFWCRSTLHLQTHSKILATFDLITH